MKGLNVSRQRASDSGLLLDFLIRYSGFLFWSGFQMLEQFSQPFGPQRQVEILRVAMHPGSAFGFFTSLGHRGWVGSDKRRAYTTQLLNHKKGSEE
jgi:hypothetical protein